MTNEIKHIWHSPLYWCLLFTGIAARVVFAYLDFRHRTETFFTLSAEYFSKLGSFTMALLILVVFIHRFSMDTETGAAPIFSCTYHGRRNLYFTRLASGVIMTVFSVIVLAGANIAVTNLFGASLSAAEAWLPDFIHHTGISVLGSIGYYLFSAFVCDIVSSQAAAMCICGLPFGFSYIINTGKIKEFDLFWFLRYGFFTEYMRGRTIASQPLFWWIWYAIMILGLFVLSLYRRKERKLL